jgi:glycogen(starch) synthase
MSIANLLPVSIVVNTVDRANSLATLLAALEHQSYPHFEVIVVVGPTHDQTLAVLAPYAGRLRVLHCPRANLSESRNIGLLAARGDIVAFIDDDAVPSYHWLAQLVAAFRAAEEAAEDIAPDIAIVGGSVYMVHPDQPAIQHWLGVMSDLGEQHDVRQDAGQDKPASPEGMGVFWTERPMGANMAFRRQTLVAEGGFDTYYRWVFDDGDVALRLALAGHGVRSLTEAPVYHVPASSRNRVVRTFTGRWWLITQASTYFAVQNGRAARQPAPQVILRVLHLIHGAWLVNGELRHAGHISRRDMWARRLRAIMAGAQGALQGLGRRRLLARPVQPDEGPIQPFLRSHSVDAPSVDPISGATGDGPWARPPLRIGLLAQPFVARGTPLAREQLATVTQALFALGHSVHVLNAAEQRRIVFQDGAYIHSELLPCGPDSLLAGVRRLLENDGIQLLVGAPADLAVAASVNRFDVSSAAVQTVVAQQIGTQQPAPGLAMSDTVDALPDNVRHTLQPLLTLGYDAAAVDQLASGSRSRP